MSAQVRAKTLYGKCRTVPYSRSWGDTSKQCMRNGGAASAAVPLPSHAELLLLLLLLLLLVLLVLPPPAKASISPGPLLALVPLAVVPLSVVVSVSWKAPPLAGPPVAAVQGSMVVSGPLNQY